MHACLCVHACLHVACMFAWTCVYACMFEFHVCFSTSSGKSLCGGSLTLWGVSRSVGVYYVGTTL